MSRPLAGMADRELQKKIGALLHELRSWEPEDDRASVDDLARRHGLDPFVVRRIAASEGHDLRDDGGELATVDPNASTLDLDPEAVRRALEEPQEGDVDTGVWKQNRQTGEWVRIDVKPAEDED